VEFAQLKAAILKLLREDEEFRYAVGGLIGLEEILRRLDRHGEELVKIWEELARLREDMNKGFAQHEEELAKLRAETERVFRRLDALGARWGVMSEAAFREGLRGVDERESSVSEWSVGRRTTGRGGCSASPARWRWISPLKMAKLFLSRLRPTPGRPT